MASSLPGGEFYDEVYSPRRQYGQYRQTNRLTDRYKQSKTDTMKTKLKEKIKNQNLKLTVMFSHFDKPCDRQADRRICYSNILLCIAAVC